MGYRQTISCVVPQAQSNTLQVVSEDVSLMNGKHCMGLRIEKDFRVLLRVLIKYQKACRGSDFEVSQHDAVRGVHHQYSFPFSDRVFADNVNTVLFDQNVDSVILGRANGID